LIRRRNSIYTIFGILVIVLIILVSVYATIYAESAKTLDAFEEGKEVTIETDYEGNHTLRFKVPKSAKFEIANLEVSTCGDAPDVLQVKLGERGKILYSFGGGGYGSFGLQNRFKNGESSLELRLSGNTTREVLIPSNATIRSAEVEISGLNLKGGAILTCIEDVTCIIYDRYSDLFWYGTYGGLVRYDASTGSVIAYTTTDGLSCPWVTCLAADNEVVYVGTKYGGVSLFLKRQMRFAPYWGVDNGMLPEDEINAIHVDGDIVYVGTASEGVARFSKAQSAFISAWSTDNELANNNILSITSDDKMVYIGSEDGVFCYNKITNAFDAPLTMDSGLESNTINSLCLGEYNGEAFLFIGTDEGISKYSKKENRIVATYNKNSGLSSNDIKDMVFNDGKLYAIAFKEGYDAMNDWYLPRTLMVIDCANGIQRVYYDERNGLSRYANALAVKDGTIMIGTMKDGVYKLEATSTTNTNTNTICKVSRLGNSLSHIPITSVISDERNIYYGSKHGEIMVYSKNENKFIGRWDVSQGISFNDVTCMERVDIGDRSSLYVGTKFGGLMRVNLSGGIEEKWNATTEIAGLGNLGTNLITCLEYDELEGIIYIGTENGLFRMYAINSTFIGKWDRTSGLGENKVSCVSLDGRTLLIGTNSKGLDRYNLTTKNFETPLNLDSGLSEDSIICAFGNENNIFVVTPHNVDMYVKSNGGFAPPLNISTGLPAQNVVDAILYGDYIFILSRLAGDTITYLSKYSLVTSQFVTHWNWKELGDREADKLYIDGNMLYILTESCVSRLDIYSNRFKDSSEYWNYVEPVNVSIDVGADGFIDWKLDGKFNTTQNLDLLYSFQSALARYRKDMKEGNVDSYGNMLSAIPINFSADSGTLVVRRISILYNYTARLNDFSNELTQYVYEHSYEVDRDGNIEIPIVVHFSSAGRCKIHNLSIVYSKSARNSQDMPSWMNWLAEYALYLGLGLFIISLICGIAIRRYFLNGIWDKKSKLDKSKLDSKLDLKLDDSRKDRRNARLRRKLDKDKEKGMRADKRANKSRKEKEVKTKTKNRSK